MGQLLWHGLFLYLYISLPFSDDIFCIQAVGNMHFSHFVGKTETTAAATDCSALDIVFIIDTSISVDFLEWDDFRRFLQEFVEDLIIGPFDTQVGFVSYSNVATVCATLDRYPDKRSVVNGIWRDIIHIAHMTNTDQGLYAAATQVFGQAGDRPDHNNLAILLTDGHSHRAVGVAAGILRHVADVVAIGIDGAKDYQLQEIVNYDAARWFMVNRFSELQGKEPDLMAAACREYTRSVDIFTVHLADK